jgi:arsenate reductase
MAEGIVNHFLSDTWHASSAGIKPIGYVHPLAIQVMNELGIDIANNHSKSVEEYRNKNFDLVITVCDGAAKNCPVWLGRGHLIHIGFDDPAYAEGSEQKRLKVFRRVRDEIKGEIIERLQYEKQ